MMKKTVFLLSMLLAAATLSAREVERVYVSTDRTVYVSGDDVWVSLFVCDLSGRPSTFSAVAYLELLSPSGAAVEAKISLLDGRGAGIFRLPSSIPTGTYRLSAYTALNTSETTDAWRIGDRFISVFNISSKARLDSLVVLTPEEDYRAEARSSSSQGKVMLSAKREVSPGEKLVISLLNQGADADVSLSVYHDDGIATPSQEHDIASFVSALGSSAPVYGPSGRLPEYDGEIIRATVIGRSDKDDEASLSTAGEPSNIYIGRNDGAGNYLFQTNNIYGEREIVCELSSTLQDDASLRIESPFIHPSALSLPSLQLSEAIRSDLTLRKRALAAESAARPDTLVEFMPYRRDLILGGGEKIHYHLDDYVRFPSVIETIVEIVPSLQLKKSKGEWKLTMIAQDATGFRRYKTENLLVLMDGVILSDISNIVSFDAMLLEDIDIYDRTVVFGRTAYRGAVNFVTKKNYVTVLDFPSNVTVTDFHGVSYPVAYRGGAAPGSGQDLRQLLYWDPVMKMASGKDTSIEIKAPSYKGQFRVVAEGFASDGSPIFREAWFEVR